MPNSPDSFTDFDMTIDTIPVVGTRLVCEDEVPWPRTQLCSPEEVATFFRAYFRDQCQEEFWIVLLSTANTVLALSRLSVGGLAASIVEPRAAFQTQSHHARTFASHGNWWRRAS